jgi:hypothetical protein
MGRNKTSEDKKHKKIAISMDRSIYFYLKERKIKVSTYINQMLKVAINSGSTNNTNSINYTPSLKPGKLESNDYASSNLVLCVFLILFN